MSWRATINFNDKSFEYKVEKLKFLNIKLSNKSGDLAVVKLNALNSKSIFKRLKKEGSIRLS